MLGSERYDLDAESARVRCELVAFRDACVPALLGGVGGRQGVSHLHWRTATERLIVALEAEPGYEIRNGSIVWQYRVGLYPMKQSAAEYLVRLFGGSEGPPIDPGVRTPPTPQAGIHRRNLRRSQTLPSVRQRQETPMDLSEYRGQFPSFRPHGLALHRDGRHLELISWPWNEDDEEEGPFYIMARTPNDPTTVQSYRISGDDPDLYPLMARCELDQTTFVPLVHSGADTRFINCTTCGRGYYLDDKGNWSSDRPLTFIRADSGI
jgi:hypothetical protein